MPSTYSTNLRFELMATGEKSGTWGTISNTNIGTLIEQAISGVASVTHDDSASYSLTTGNGTTDEARNAVVNVTGTLTAERNLVVPSVDKLYVIKNSTSGASTSLLKLPLALEWSLKMETRKLFSAMRQMLRKR